MNVHSIYNHKMSPYYITIELGGFKVKFGSFLGKIQLHLTGRTSKITERQKNTSNGQRSSSIFFYNYSESSVSQSFCNYISKIL